MDTYSVLDALRQTKMGKLSYCRDFDIRDFERLSLGSPEKADIPSAVSGPDAQPVNLADEKENVRDSTKNFAASDENRNTPPPLRKSVLHRRNSSLAAAASPVAGPASATSTGESATSPNASTRRFSKVTFHEATPEKAIVIISKQKMSPTVESKTTTTPTGKTITPTRKTMATPAIASTVKLTTPKTPTISSPSSTPLNHSAGDAPSLGRSVSVTSISSISSSGATSPRSPRSPLSISKKEWETLKALNDYQEQVNIE